MLDQVTSEDTLVLEGPIEHPQQHVRWFRTMSALCDFVKSFNIPMGQFEPVQHPEHGQVIQLVYTGVER
ncbi:hypothetical protein D3C78_741270 [compost metagenome]